jgi:broad specificity phosphatase PhoE
MTLQRVHLLRHGETQNPEGIVYGARPFKLTELGERQAAAAAVHLNYNYPKALVYSSPVERAYQTASFVDDLPFVDERLTETISIFDGQKVGAVASQRAHWKSLTNPHTPSWNEPYVGVNQRMSEAVRDALALREDDVVLVSHQLPIWIYRLGLEGRPFFHDPLLRQCGHASITTVQFEDGEPLSIEYWENPEKRKS